MTFSLSSERLQLVEIDPEKDAPIINALILGTFDTLHPWKLWAEKPPSIDDTLRDCEKWKEYRINGNMYKFGIYSKVSRQY